MADRPSYLEVDARIVTRDLGSLEPLRGDPEWDAHLAETAPLDEIPAWVLELDRPRQRRRWWPWLAAALAAALALVAALPRDPYVGDKGAPAALLHVQRSGTSALWDGQPLRAGDRFRVELADLDAPHFAVLYLSPDEPPAVLATGAGEGLLDGAWALDAPAAGARLVVVASPHDLSGLPADRLLALPHAAELPLR